jgi:hypothetical protein
MRRADDVFFFTLIDFLLQIFFFGLLLFVVGKAADAHTEARRTLEAQQIGELTKAAGVSNLTELLDYLTKLAPLEHLQGTADFLERVGGQEKALAMTEIIRNAGGVEAVQEKLKKYDNAYGLPPCLTDVVNGKAVPRTLAVVRVEDDLIEIERSSADLERLLAQMGTDLATVRRLTPKDFKHRFEGLKNNSPPCRYFVEMKITTKFIDPVRAVWANFRQK